MQVTVVVATCYFPAGHFYYYSQCVMWHVALQLPWMPLDQWCLLLLFFFPFLLFPFLSQQQPGAGMSYLTEGSSSACQWKMQEHFFVDFDLFYRNKFLEITIIFQGLEQKLSTVTFTEKSWLKADLCLLDPVRSCFFLFSKHFGFCFGGSFAPGQATAISSLCNPVIVPAIQDCEPVRVSYLHQKRILICF